MSAHLSPRWSRRRFLGRLLGAGAFAAAGGLPSLAQQIGTSVRAESFRFAFLTDLHLMRDPALRSVEGIALCLDTVEKLDPRPEFILAGGDLVHLARDMTIPQAKGSLDEFLAFWHSHTSLPARWTFGNHDLAGTSNPSVSPADPDYAKGLFKERLGLPRLFQSFDCKGWHFVILDDIALQPDHSYIGQLFDDELAFLRTDLDAHRHQPTIVCTHIPVVSNLPFGLLLAHAAQNAPTAPPKNLVCTNGSRLLDDMPGHNIRAVLCGHLHFYETIARDGVQFINSGAVCGSYWKGSMHGCPEGFGVVDLGADGSVKFDYRTYGWKA